MPVSCRQPCDFNSEGVAEPTIWGAYCAPCAVGALVYPQLCLYTVEGGTLYRTSTKAGSWQQILDALNPPTTSHAS